MRRIVLSLMLITLIATAAEAKDFWDGIKASIQSHLGQPYVWGSSGLKSFDCSGFIWRVMYDNGVLVKRTTARKFYMALPKAQKSDETKFGTLVFFDDLKHVGIVDDASSFYHAQVSIGTNRSPMNSFWRPKVFGYRLLPVPEPSRGTSF